MKKPAGLKTPKGGHHAPSKPRLRTRHLSSTGKSAYAGPGGGAGIPAFPSAPGGAAFPDPSAGAPGAMPDPGAGGADSSPLAGAAGGPPGM